MVVGDQFGDKSVGSGFDICESVGGRDGFDGGSFGGFGLVKPKMQMSLAGNQAGMGFVVYQNEVGHGDFNCDFGAGDDLIRSRRDERGGSDQKGRKHEYKYDIFKL